MTIEQNYLLARLWTLLDRGMKLDLAMRAMSLTEIDESMLRSLLMRLIAEKMAAEEPAEVF